MNLITVFSPDGRAFWERHQDHPGGEVFIGPEFVTQVAMTPSVQAALKNGRLVELPPLVVEWEPGPAVVETVELFALEQPEEVDATDAARELAAELQIDLWSVIGTLKNGRVGVDDVRSAADNG